MKTNHNSVGLAFDILTVTIIYAILLLINYIIFGLVILFYPVNWHIYPAVKQVIEKAHLILPLVTLFLAILHGFVFLLEVYVAPRLPEVEESEVGEREGEKGA